MTRRLAAIGLASTLALGACSPSGIDMTNTSSGGADKGAGAEPQYRQNPAPKQGYRITMKITDAPGPFAMMRGLAQFDVVNPECLPPPKENFGHLWPVPTEGIEIPLEKVAEDTYSGVVYADQMLDEDYFGYGTCHWKLIQAQVQLKATGAQVESKFMPSINADKIVSGQGEQVYMSKRAYPRAEIPDFPTFGETDRSIIKVGDDELFVITLSSGKEPG